MADGQATRAGLRGIETTRDDARAPLNGWRNIAAYLACDPSTAKRWAATRNLPVYRPAGSEARKGVPVFAFADDLDGWLKGHAADVNESAPSEAEVVRQNSPARPEQGPWRPRRWRRLGYTAIALCFLVIAGSGGALLTLWQSEGSVSYADPYDAVPDDARNLYLEAYYLWQKRTPQTLTEARRLLTRALELAPRFAQAQADLATVYDLMVEYDVMRPEDGYAMSRAAAERSIALDPTLAQPYSVLGDIVYFWDRSYEAGLDHFRRGVELDSRNVIAHHWYASALMASGHFDDAAREIGVARALEPLSRSIIVSEAMIRLGQGQATRAQDLLEGLVANEPEYRSPYRFLAFSSLALGDYSGYLAALHKRFALVDDPVADRIVSAGEAALRAGGREEMAKALLAATAQDADLVKDPSIVAHFLALGGDWQRAVQWLAKTPTRRVSYYGIDPAYEQARQDPGFRQAILKAAIPATW